MKIGKMLKIYSDINDIGTREIAKDIGVSHTTISRIMQGKSTDITTAVKLLSWLFEE
jgi:transcriptional regulator with XRE-family HTH domain